jgi:ABC-type taurine transport system substrate-binding protein
VSDLPKENIIFLEKDKETGQCKVSKLQDRKETFGANIHTLFADSFFMDKNGGLMGEFAKAKIQTLIDYLDGQESEIKDDQNAQKLLDLIGEPILKRQLQKKLFEKRIKNKEKAEKITILKQLLAQAENDTDSTP